MTDASILVLRPGQVTSANRTALRKAGVIVIEADDPSEVRFMQAHAELSSTEMLALAMRALQKSISGEAHLGEEIAAAIVSKASGPTA